MPNKLVTSYILMRVDDMNQEQFSRNLKVNDVLYGEESYAYIETVKSIEELNVGLGETQKRILIQTEPTDCSDEFILMDALLKRPGAGGLRSNVHLKEQSELDCAGNIKSSMYVISTDSGLNVNANDVIGGRSYSASNFAVRILSLRRIGAYMAVECVSLAQLDKLKRFSINKDYAYLFAKKYGYDLNAQGKKLFSYLGVYHFLKIIFFLNNRKYIW